MSNYATKADFKNSRGIDISFAKMVDLANFKSNLEKLDTDKLKKFSNLSN